MVNAQGMPVGIVGGVESSSGDALMADGYEFLEEELDEVLVKITENDADFCSTRSRKRLNNSQQTARFQLMFCKNADCKLLDDPTHTLLSDKLQKNFHFKSSDY